MSKPRSTRLWPGWIPRFAGVPSDVRDLAELVVGQCPKDYPPGSIVPLLHGGLFLSWLRDGGQLTILVSPDEAPFLAARRARWPATLGLWDRLDGPGAAGLLVAQFCTE